MEVSSIPVLTMWCHLVILVNEYQIKPISHTFRNAHSTSMNYFNEKDICASVVSLLKEWIDPSLVAENPSVLPILKNFAALAMEGWETIVVNLQRYQRDDDSQDNTLKG